MTKEAIVKAASKMESTHDLLVLLNKIKMDELGKIGHPFTMPQLNFFINPKRTASRYRTFTIPKKSGGVRTISAPIKLLKSFQTYVNRLLQAFYDAPECVTGFVPEKSVVDNAEQHIGQTYVFNSDLKDFFTSISQARIWGALKTMPFNFPEKIAAAIAGMCCIQEIVQEEDGNVKKRYVLPQGSPCSPVLTNIVCHNLDWKLSGLARRFHVRYSRYADDITFSGNHNVFQNDSEFMTEFRRIVKEQNFVINEKKTRLQKRGSRQEVTGLVVSDRVNVTREYIRDVDNLLYIWEKHGHKAAFAKFLMHYIPKQNLHTYNPNMENVLGGKLNYLRMVKGDDSTVWRRLQKRYNKLMDRKESAGGTNIMYKHVYSISAFEQALGVELHLAHDKEEVFEGEQFLPPPAPYFELNGRTHMVSLSKYSKTRLGNILKSGDPAQLQKFRDTFLIASCVLEGQPEKDWFWMIIRKLPKKKDQKPIIEDVDTLLAILGEQIIPMVKCDSAPKDLPGLTTDEILGKLVNSDFDLNTLDEWDKIRSN